MKIIEEYALALLGGETFKLDIGKLGELIPNSGKTIISQVQLL